MAQAQESRFRPPVYEPIETDEDTPDAEQTEGEETPSRDETGAEAADETDSDADADLTDASETEADQRGFETTETVDAQKSPTSERASGAGNETGRSRPQGSERSTSSNVSEKENKPEKKRTLVSMGSGSGEDGESRGPKANSDVSQAGDDWGSPQPILTLHGYLRTRAEWQRGFFLGREPGVDPNVEAPDLPFGRYRPFARGLTPAGGCSGGEAVEDTGAQDQSASPCGGSALRFANMRLRLEPTIAVSDDVKVHMRLDVLDNLVLGSTPNNVSYPSINGGATRTPGVTGRVFPDGAAASSGGQNSFQDSIVVRRAWAEVTQRSIGQLRFGRMGWHWGLGMVSNDGAGIDGDFATDVDRIMGITKIAGWTLAASYDFADEGFIQQPVVRINNRLYVDPDGLAFDPTNGDDLNQYTLTVAHRLTEEEQSRSLKLGKAVVNGGLQFVYRKQFLEVDPNTTPGLYADANDLNTGVELFRRNAWSVVPNLWMQFLWKSLRIEMEAALVYGKVDDLNVIDASRSYELLQGGLTLESEYRHFDDKLGVYFNAGYASGDSQARGLSLYDDPVGSESNDRISTFGFHRNYRVDLILWRNIMGRVAGAYYLKPGVSYDFLRSDRGRLAGARFDMIWSRAANKGQAYGNARDLGVELNISAYFRSELGPSFTDGFYAMLQYGVLFPLKGLGFVNNDSPARTVSPDMRAQTARLVMGVEF